MKNRFKRTLVVILALVVLTGLYSIYINFKRSTVSNTESEGQLFEPAQFESEILNFKVSYPKSYKVTDKLSDVILENERGKIMISRSGTNYETAEEYWQSLDWEGRYGVQTTKEKINGLDAISAVINTSKIYKLYKEGIVYTLSSEEKSLFGDLDQITQSFRYTP